jgi:signal transduction histidine kinase
VNSSSGDMKTATQRLGGVIEQNQEEIERRWLGRVERDIAASPEIEPTHLRDGLPDYLHALAKLFSRTTSTNFDLALEPSWSNVAREHGITRVQIGFNINQLVHEFIILRQVIRQIAEEQGVAVDEAILADALDAAIAAAVSAYVDARDYEARKKQAENIGFLTHELRNPLSTAMLSASQLRRHAGEKHSRLLDALDRSHKILSDLIDSVLLTEKLEAGKIESRPVAIKLGTLVEPALEAARHTAAAKGLAFHVNYDSEIQVHVDPLLTRSALQNIADNAAKYTDHGEVSVVVEDSRDAFVVHVRDTCGGISAEEMVTIFEPFKRGTTGKSGTGLGLAIARRAIETQGGAIQAESPGSSGCHFWITLPKRSEPERGLGYSPDSSRQ